MPTSNGHHQFCKPVHSLPHNQRHVCVPQLPVDSIKNHAQMCKHREWGGWEGQRPPNHLHVYLPHLPFYLLCQSPPILVMSHVNPCHLLCALCHLQCHLLCQSPPLCACATSHINHISCEPVSPPMYIHVTSSVTFISTCVTFIAPSHVYHVTSHVHLCHLPGAPMSPFMSLPMSCITRFSGHLLHTPRLLPRGKSRHHCNRLGWRGSAVAVVLFLLLSLSMSQGPCCSWH